MMKFVLISVLAALAVADPQPGAVEVLGGLGKTVNGAVDATARGTKSLFGIETPKVAVNLNVCAASIPSIYQFYAALGVRLVPNTYWCTCPPGYNYLNVPFTVTTS
uniref:Uncharacterized protein LOC114324900 n=1 Tax=Diabrotica virgifera virgifera TaxID=50390 RepID=A0A6P7F016_DIAVI